MFVVWWSNCFCFSHVFACFIAAVTGSGKFTYKVHHGGRMELVNDRLSYVDSKVDYVDHMVINRLSLLELDAILKKDLGYFVGGLYYMVPADATEFIFLDSDSTLLSVVGMLLERTFLLPLYCDHRVE